MSHLFQLFNASSPPRGSVCITGWRGCTEEPGKFFMLSSKLRTYHVSTCTHFHDQIVSWDLPLNDAWAEFKAKPVQRKSDLISTQSSLNVIMPKSSWLAPHPLRCSRRRAFGSLKTLFNPSRRISHHLCCGSLPLAFFLQVVAESWILFKMSVSLFTAGSFPHFATKENHCDPKPGALKEYFSDIYILSSVKHLPPHSKDFNHCVLWWLFSISWMQRGSCSEDVEPWRNLNRPHHEKSKLFKDQPWWWWVRWLKVKNHPSQGRSTNSWRENQETPHASLVNSPQVAWR